jgi:hypothetical protein
VQQVADGPLKDLQKQLVHAEIQAEGRQTFQRDSKLGS